MEGHKRESDDITLYDPYHGCTHRHTHAQTDAHSACLVILLMKTSLHVCTAAGTNLTAVYMLRSESKNEDKETDLLQRTR